MSKHLTYRENKGQIQPSVKLQKIKVDIYEKLQYIVKGGPTTKLIDSREITILPSEQGRYDLTFLEEYILREFKLFIDEDSIPLLEGTTDEDEIHIEIIARHAKTKAECQRLEGE